MKIYKGNILTCDENNTVAKYLVEENGKIAYVGDELNSYYEECLKKAKAELVELGEKALIPSFADNHLHFASYATFHTGLDVMKAKSNVEVLQMLKDYVDSHPKAKMIFGFGASKHVEEGVIVSREQLDSVCPNKPVFMVKFDGHACVINSKLLEMVRSKVGNMRGFEPETGEMLDEAFYAISDYVTNSISILDLVKNMQETADFMASKGIGMFHTVSGVGFTGDLDVDLERWFAAGLDNGLQMRVFMQTMTPKKVIKRGMKRIGGCFECALDGAFGSANAAVLEPYEGTEADYGVLYYDDEKVKQFCKEANRAGLQIQLHAIGDAAVKQAADALKYALDDYPREDHRHGIIHAMLPTKESLEICRDYKLTIPAQSAFISWNLDEDSSTIQLLGKERALAINPLRTFLDYGLSVSAGSDAPCTVPDPMIWIHKACNHTTPEQSMTVQEALRMSTYEGYYATFDEKERGSLEVGKLADMVILSKNPYDVDKTELKDIQIEQLLLQGKPYQKISRGPISHILHGMLNSKKRKV